MLDYFLKRYRTYLSKQKSDLFRVKKLPLKEKLIYTDMERVQLSFEGFLKGSLTCIAIH